VTVEEKLLSGWGRTAATRAQVITPTGADDVADLLGARGPRGALARGLGRSYGDAAQNAGGLVLDMTAMSTIKRIDPALPSVTAEAGASLKDLVTALLPHGLFLPVTPGTQHVTLGGAIAADVHGKNHHADGSLCAHVTSLVLQTPTGRRLTLDPVTAPDEFHATAGGMGLTGIVLEATLRPIRVASAYIAEQVERAADIDATMARLASTDGSHRYSVAWVDCLARGRRLGRSVLMQGDHADAGMLSGAARAEPLELPQRLPLAAPPWAPPALVRRETVAIFNELYFRRAPDHAERITPLDRFFYPLDSVAGWNRVYGRRGLVQYQLVLPLGKEDVMREVIERVAASPAPATLAVLKRFGAQDGLLSFPLPGWTLAMDMPADAPQLAGLLDRLDDLTAEAGGRVYLAKDSRLRPELLERMYPELPRWREIRARLDPAGAMRSDLARRLGLLK
jgi:decaprenylphospho-beta-D-ribofuranose 2-oxidase